MKKTLLALMVLGTLSCTKESVKPLATIPEAVEVKAESYGINIGQIYETKSKDVGGYYTTTLTFIDYKTMRFTLDRGAGYYANFTGEYTLVDDRLTMRAQGSVILYGDMTYTNEGFLLVRTNGKTEVFYSK